MRRESFPPKLQCNKKWRRTIPPFPPPPPPQVLQNRSSIIFNTAPPPRALTSLLSNVKDMTAICKPIFEPTGSAPPAYSGMQLQCWEAVISELSASPAKVLRLATAHRTSSGMLAGRRAAGHKSAMSPRKGRERRQRTVARARVVHRRDLVHRRRGLDGGGEGKAGAGAGAGGREQRPSGSKRVRFATDRNTVVVVPRIAASEKRNCFYRARSARRFAMDPQVTLDTYDFYVDMLREENERAADPGRMEALRKRLAKIMKYHLLVDGTVTEPVPSKSRRRREHTDTDYQEI